MDTENTFSPELDQKPCIDVQYEKLLPEDLLIQVDGEKLAQTLKEIEYSDKVLIPLVLSGKPTLTDQGMYNGFTGKVYVYQEAIAARMRRAYKSIVDFLESDSSIPADVTNESFWQKVQQSKVYRSLNPKFWPYNMSKNANTKFYYGNADRRNVYLWAAKEGTLIPDLPRDEQIARAQEFYGKQLKRITQREVSKTLGHEYEHRNNKIMKTATMVAIGVASQGAAFGTLIGYANARGNDMSSAETIAGLGLVGVASVVGMVKGASLDEDQSYKAEEENMNKIVSCFHINEDVFKQKVLGEKNN